MKRHISLLIITVMAISMLLSMTGCDFLKSLNPPKINGVKLSKYQIVCDEDGLDYNTRAAEYIRDSIRERSGVKLDRVDDSATEGEYEIVVGETSRAISKKLDAECEGLEFAIMADGGDIALEGDYFIIAAAAYYFIETYSFNPGHEITLEDGTSVCEPIVREAKNFIMLIGDGMGIYQTKIFDYMDRDVEYSDGEDFFYGYMLPYQGFSRTRSLSGITDSAAGGTALACGYKTINEYIGRDKDLNDIKSLTELASELGKAGAVMSTETQTGATPAAFSAHANDRDSSSSIRKSQNETINKYGIIIDCGYDYYSASQLRILDTHINDTISEVAKNEKGFFLMYEEAYIDKHCHNNDIDKAFQAVIRFNQAIARFMEFAFYNPDTLVLITADHETGGLMPNESGSLIYTSDDHTANDVLIFAYGYGAELINGKTLENIEISKLFASLMGAEIFGDQSEDWKNLIYGEAE